MAVEPLRDFRRKIMTPAQKTDPTMPTRMAAVPRTESVSKKRGRCRRRPPTTLVKNRLAETPLKGLLHHAFGVADACRCESPDQHQPG
jgi:hypothetical protein